MIRMRGLYLTSSTDAGEKIRFYNSIHNISVSLDH
jgi:hypothetical protein